jgi:phosphoribosylamine--glycine ligase
MLNGKFGSASATVVIEEFLSGIECSVFVITDGKNYKILPEAKDYKRIGEGDTGLNTGGMGAYTPVPIIPQTAVEEAVNTIMIPTAKAMVENGTPFTGILYGGLILTQTGPKVIEFNARFGDPETEVVLPKMKSDMVEVILQLLDGTPYPIEWHENAFLGVVLASKGYPEAFEKGVEIRGIEGEGEKGRKGERRKGESRKEKAEGRILFHCGTAKREGRWVNNGGRVLLVVGEGKTLAEARRNAYKTVENLSCENLFYRTDIGGQAIEN